MEAASTVVAAEERPHAEISSSKIAIALHCTGSIVLARELPQKEASVAMLSGTKTHEIAEMMLEDYLQHKITGSDPDIRAHLLANDPDREERIRGYVQAVFEKALEGSVTSKAYAIEGKLTVHENFNIFGYADFWAVYRDDRARRAAVVVDLKDGQVSVEAEKNPQLAFLALGLYREFSSQGIHLDYIRAAIYQPKAREGEEYKETKFTAKQLETFEKKVLKIAEDLYLKKKFKFKAGSHCRYCRAQEVCQTYASSLQNKTSLKLLEPSSIAFPPVDKIPDDVLSNIVLHAGALDDFIKACKKYALTRQLNGHPLPNLKAVEGSSRRRIDDTKAEALQSELGGYGIDVYEPKLKGITKLSAELKKKGLKKDLIESFCTRGASPIMLVSENDPRPAIKLGADYLIDDTEETTTE